MTHPLLEIEEKHNLWDAEVDGLKLWPLVRFFLLNEFIMDDLGYAPLTKEGRKTYFAPNKWRRYLRTLPFLLAPKREMFDVLFMIPNLHRYPADAGSFDRRYSEFYERVGHPLILESAPTSFMAKPDRQLEPVIFSQDILWLWAMARVKLQPLAPDVLKKIDEFAQFLAQIYDKPLLQARLAGYMRRFAGEYKMVRPVFTRIIAPKLKNRLLFFEDGHNLGRNALVTKTFHDLGFHIAEPQHGMITPVHFAYQYPPACLQPEHICHAYLPDTLLTYGSYWSDIATIPGKKRVIGLPYLSKIAQNAAAPTKAKQILILSSWVISEATVALAKQVAAAFPDWTTVFKLHPLEDPTAPVFEPLREHTNIQVVTRADVYQLVAESGVIAALYSTAVLVETTIFPGKRIFFHELGTLPPDIGEYFEDADDLIQLIGDPSRGFSRSQPDQFWASDWQHNLEQFLSEQIPHS